MNQTIKLVEDEDKYYYEYKKLKTENEWLRLKVSQLEEQLLNAEYKQNQIKSEFV